MRFIVLHHPSVEVVLVEADVPQPLLMPADDHEQVARRIRRMALERELAALRAEDDDTPISAPNLPPMAEFGRVELVVGADGKERTERHIVASVPGPTHLCVCGRAFYVHAALAEHASACAMAREATTIKGNAMPGKRVHGSIAPTFSVE